VTCADGRGETHFDVRDITDREGLFGPAVAAKGLITDFGAVTNMFVFSMSGTNVTLMTRPNITSASFCRVRPR